MIRIAIDGPGGAGKSSVAKAVAKKLGIIYVDTGALYRNIGLFMLRSGIDVKDASAVTAALPSLTLELQFKEGKQIILLCGEDMGDAIRTPEVSMAASAVSAIGAVREYLLEMQRDTARKNSVIMDGRDIGTVILPDAEVKIFLTASAEARAKRRYAELCAKGVETTYENVYNEMVERDKNDSTRDIAPCVQAEDALLLDNSDLTAEQTVDAVLDIVAEKEKAAGKKKNKRTMYMKFHRVLAPIIRFIMRLKPVNLENLPAEGGIIICSNHISALDVFSIAAVAPRQIRFVAKKELFSIPIVGSVIKAFGAIKIDRGSNDTSAIRLSVNEAKSGFPVAIFPQGHRYPGVNPATTPTKHGAALIAYRAGCPVIPVSINTKKGRYCLFRKVEIVFGKVIELDELNIAEGGRDEYKLATDKIYSEITKLGIYSSLPAYSAENDKHNRKKKKR